MGNFTPQRHDSPSGASYDEDDSLYATAMSSGATPEDIEEQRKDTENGHAYPSHMPEITGAHEQQRQLGEHTFGQFHEKWNIVKRIALGSVMGTIQTMARQQLPTLASYTTAF